MRAHLLTFLFMLSAGWGWAEIRIVGSDLLGPGLAETMQAYARRNELGISLKLEGSYAGWRELQARHADIALLSFPPGEPLPQPPYHSMPLAYHTAVVLVPEVLPLAQISFGQLAGIFGATERSSLRRWGDLGLTGEWTARSISPRALAPKAGLALGIFRHGVIKAGELKPGVLEQDAIETLLRRLATEEGGIALAATVPPDGMHLKALYVAMDDQAVAYAPTPENVHRGDYPLRWPVYLVFRRADAPRLYDVLRHLLGGEVAQQLANAGLTPVPAPARNEQIFGLEQL